LGRMLNCTAWLQAGRPSASKAGMSAQHD
jgi:hypothetical protein